MKVDFKLHPFNVGAIAKNNSSQELSFSLVGQTAISKDTLSKPQVNIEEIKNKILTELVSLLQLELYGELMSNESAQEKKDEKET